ncbi:MAG TPA: NmrA family NAD(P)-binding protein, partial [Kiloniellaceae bacterium]|nr:NmrA family NAD(P)-binding protein [Kiloniellaceae bacterium]
DRPALEKALSGVERVFVVTGHNPQLAEQQINALEASKAVGAKLFIKVSSAKVLADPNSDSVVGRSHYAVEEAIRKSGLDWVILRPGLFMQNTFQQAALIKAESKLVLPFAADLPIAFIDVRDTGALGARVCLDPSTHVGKELAFTGAASSYAEFATVLSEVIGKPVTYVAASLERAEQAMRGGGFPDWLVAHLLAVAKIAADGALSREVAQPIRGIVGREPLTIRQFVEDHKDMFV